MPLTTLDGLEVPLVRPKFDLRTRKERKKDEPSRRQPRPIRAANFPLPKVKDGCGNSSYKGKKVHVTFNMPPLVVLTLRNHINSHKKFPSDAITEILTFYLDDKYVGWDINVGSVTSIGTPKGAVGQGLKGQGRKKREVEMVQAEQFGRKPSMIHGPKIEQQYNLLEQIYVTVRSIAKVRNCPMSDIAAEAVMYYFDEIEPGWELTGDE